MELKKIVMAVAVASAFSAGANASVVSVGGVTWDTEAATDFFADTSLTEVQVSNVGDTLSGYGIVTSFNSTSGANQSSFCASCQLTFSFDNYSLSSTSGNDFAFSGGVFNIYVQDTGAADYSAYDLGNASTATDGTLWLSLVGVDYFDAAYGSLGSLFGTLTAGSLTSPEADEAGSGNGFLSVVGGLAADYFDTNTFDGLFDEDGNEIKADLLFSSSFQPNNYPTGLALRGTGEIQGDTQAVPEPSSIALLGAGVLAAGLGFRRRKQNQA